MLADLLKKETLTNHQQLEKMLIGRIKAIRTTQDYIDLLQLFYTYFGGLEKKIDQHLDKTLLPDYDQRRKSTSLAHDITTLDGIPQPVASEDSLPQIADNQQAMAALYVIEGSTLGGQFISKMIARQLNITDGAGLSFFNSYGQNTEYMWNIFKDAMNKQGLTEGDSAKVIATANDTFVRFSNWAANTLS